MNLRICTTKGILTGTVKYLLMDCCDTYDQGMCFSTNNNKQNKKKILTWEEQNQLDKTNIKYVGRNMHLMMIVT